MWVSGFASGVKVRGTSEGEMTWAGFDFGARKAAAVSWVTGVSAAALCLARSYLHPLRPWR